MPAANQDKRCFINPKRLSETFEHLVRIDSVSKEEGGLCDKLVKIFKGMGAKTYIDSAGDKIGGDTGNLIVKFKGKEDLPAILFGAHMDTVEPGRGITPIEKDGVFKSDGTTILGADDKSAIAIIIEAARVINENNFPSCPIELVFTVCEEVGLLGAKNLDFGLISAKYGYVLDSAETEGIVTRAPAANRIELKVHGKDSHAGASPEKGINAIWLASKAIAGMKLGRIDDETTCNIGIINGGVATNIVPSFVKVSGEARSHNQKKLDEITKSITSGFMDVIKKYSHLSEDKTLPSLEYSVENDFLLMNIPEDHPVVKLARQASEKIGKTMVTKTTGGGSDANIFYKNGITCGVLGTGMRDVHTVRESVRINDMACAAELVLKIIKLHSKGDVK